MLQAVANLIGQEYVPQIWVDDEVIWEGEACKTAKEATEQANAHARQTLQTAKRTTRATKKK